MSDLERELREGLRRVDAPEGFAERVLDRAKGQRGAGKDVRGGWWRAVAAAFLLGAVCGGWLMHEERVDRADRRQAMETKQQFDVAMRITGRSLAEAQRKIEQAGAKGEAR